MTMLIQKRSSNRLKVVVSNLERLKYSPKGT